MAERPLSADRKRGEQGEHPGSFLRPPGELLFDRLSRDVEPVAIVVVTLATSARLPMVVASAGGRRWSGCQRGGHRSGGPWLVWVGRESYHASEVGITTGHHALGSRTFALALWCHWMAITDWWKSYVSFASTIKHDGQAR